MIHTIQNEYLAVSVKQTGAELCSIRSLKTGLEYIWEAIPEQWPNSAPILFPVIGMLRNQSYLYNNEKYSVPRHGFARNNPNFVLTDDGQKLSFSLSHSDETLAMYPFQFRFTISFVLQDNTLDVLHQIHNLGQETMYFSLGAHPGFRCPRHWGEAYNDYYLEFEKAENSRTWSVVTDGLIGKKTRPFFENNHILPLNKELFAHDALVFKDLKSNYIALKSRTSPEVLTVGFEGFPFMGIWARYGSDFVCIEPWQGIADAEDASGKIEEKEGIIALAGGKTHHAKYSIRIAE